MFINVYVLFFDKFSILKINEIFFRFFLKLIDDSGKKVYVCESSVCDSGYNVDIIVVNFSDLFEYFLLVLRFFIDYIVVVCLNGYGGYCLGVIGCLVVIVIEIDC